MMQLSMTARRSAAIIAAIAWTAIFGQMALNFAAASAKGEPLWPVPLAMLGYFTIWSNTLVALIATHAARSGSDEGLFGRPATLGAAVAYIIVVGVIYNTLLAGLRHLDGVPKLMDTLLHVVMPLAYTLWWAVFVPRGRLGWGHLAPALLFPVAYCLVAMARGAVTGKYAYFFIDVAKHGLPHVLLNIAGLVVLFAGLLAAVIAYDRSMARASGALSPQ